MKTSLNGSLIRKAIVSFSLLAVCVCTRNVSQVQASSTYDPQVYEQNLNGQGIMTFYSRSSGKQRVLQDPKYDRAGSKIQSNCSHARRWSKTNIGTSFCQQCFRVKASFSKAGFNKCGVSSVEVLMIR